MTRRSTRIAALTLLTATALTAVGCNAPYSSTTHRAFVNNPSPTLDGMADRSVDIDNRIAITTDTNLRIMQEDLLSFGLLDRPRRSTRYPIAY